MIYKFKSQASAEVIMQQFNGDQMLALVGREPAHQGVITVAQIPAAVAAIEEALEGSRPFPERSSEIRVNVTNDSSRLRHLAIPFIELLRSSAAAGKDVVWGV
jgi:cyclopropane-fatty-acyl-phospholipid synthase